jgi:hypothetical protein
MAHAVLILNSVQAHDVNALLRECVSGSTLDNGNVFALNTSASGVWTATVATGSATALWMCATPEIPFVMDSSGEIYRVGTDPREFYVPAGRTFTAFKPKVGDIITLTADAFSNAIGGNTFANASAGSWLLTWGASQGAGLSLKLVETTFISIGRGIENARVTAYKLMVVGE